MAQAREEALNNGKKMEENCQILDTLKWQDLGIICVAGNEGEVNFHADFQVVAWLMHFL